MRLSLAILLAIEGQATTAVFHRATAIKEHSKALPSGTALVVKFFTPWCGHCRSLAPSIEIAREALLSWDPEDVHGTEFGEMDCERDAADCRKLGISAYPTIKFYDGTGNEYMEYPRLPRTPESLTAYLAQFRRKIRPYPIVMRTVYAAHTCASSLKFKDALCRAFRVENFLLGSKETLESFNTRFKNAPKALLEFYSDSSEAGDSLAPGELCIIDRFSGEKRYCQAHFDADSDASITDFRKNLQRHRHPYLVPEASWYDFFALRLAMTNRRLVIISAEAVPPFMAAALARKFYETYNFLTVGVDSRTHAVFEQAGKTGGVLVFEASKYDKGFFHLPSEHAANLESWLEKITEKGVVKEYPPGHRSALSELRHTVKTFRQFVSGAVKNLSLRRKAQLVLTLVGLAGAWIYMVLPEASAAAARKSVRALKTASSAVAKNAQGVCIVNGKILE